MDFNLLVSLSLLLAVVTGKPVHTEPKNSETLDAFVEADDSLEKSELEKLKNALFTPEKFISKDFEYSSKKSLILNALTNHEERNPMAFERTHISAVQLPGSTAGRQRRSVERHRRRATDQHAEPRTEIDKTAELCREVCRYILQLFWFQIHSLGSQIAVSMLPDILSKELSFSSKKKLLATFQSIPLQSL